MVLDRLPTGLLVAGLACVISAAATGSIAYGFGFRYAEALGNSNLQTLKTTHAEQAGTAEKENRLQLLQQVARANESESLLFAAYESFKEEKRQLQERIPHVTTQYIPAPGAVAKPIPRCVFTAGWLRDFNTALGVSAPRPGTTAAAAEKAAWPATGTDAELLESGVTPADILAHAQDYGLWARSNLVQLNALLDLQEKD
ncbi:lysis protein [Pseudomonas sp. P42]|nr:lysis protein [Pseudomonas sp. P42]MBP5951324.1 lysis protein [Pseudomonas sp. P42]